MGIDSDRGKVRRSIKQLQRVKTWQLVVLLVLSGFISATFLRLNNIGMVERRNAVLSADEVGNIDTTVNRLYDLQRYVSAHMNADMGKGLYLEASYKRDVQTAYDKVSSDSNPNGNIYVKAQDACAPKFSRWSMAYVQCTTSELAKYPAADSLSSDVKLPKADTYLHVFVSPVWSSDFAGWSVLISAVIGLMIIVRLLGLLTLKLILRQQYKNE